MRQTPLPSEYNRTRDHLHGNGSDSTTPLDIENDGDFDNDGDLSYAEMQELQHKMQLEATALRPSKITMLSAVHEASALDLIVNGAESWAEPENMYTPSAFPNLESNNEDAELGSRHAQNFPVHNGSDFLPVLVPDINEVQLEESDAVAIPPVAGPAEVVEHEQPRMESVILEESSDAAPSEIHQDPETTTVTPAADISAADQPTRGRSTKPLGKPRRSKSSASQQADGSGSTSGTIRVPKRSASSTSRYSIVSKVGRQKTRRARTTSARTEVHDEPKEEASPQMLEGASLSGNFDEYEGSKEARISQTQRESTVQSSQAQLAGGSEDPISFYMRRLKSTQSLSGTLDSFSESTSTRPVSASTSGFLRSYSGSYGSMMSGLGGGRSSVTQPPEGKLQNDPGAKPISSLSTEPLGPNMFEVVHDMNKRQQILNPTERARFPTLTDPGPADELAAIEGENAIEPLAEIEKLTAMINSSSLPIPAFLRRRGILYGRVGRYDEAMTDLSKAIHFGNCSGSSSL
jgi:hypothetical protein